MGQGEWQLYCQVSANNHCTDLCKHNYCTSLQTIIAQVSANSYCIGLYKHNHCTGLCKQLLHMSLQTQSLHRSLQTIITQISANTIIVRVSANNHCSRTRSLQTCKHHPWWLTSDHWLATSQRRSCTAAKSLLPGLSDTESFQHHPPPTHFPM